MLSTAEKLNLMQDLFVHEHSAFAEQVYEEDKGVMFYPKREGWCNHTPKHRPRDCPDVHEIDFNNRFLMEHLKGEKTYAPYQLKGGKIKWVCIDIDGYHNVSNTDLKSMTLELAAAIHTHVGPKTFLVEQSGSKGYHLWIFFSEPVMVDRGFALGHWITSLVESPPGMNLEVYPKQTRNKLFGNTVKLPLGIHQKTKTRCWFVNAKFESYENPWQQMIDVNRVTPEWVEQHVPKVQMKTREASFDENDPTPMCFTKLLDEGGNEGVRDEAAFRIACYMRYVGLPERYAERMLFDWNTINTPMLDDEQLSMKIESAYGEPYRWLPCGSPAFDAYCSSTCYFWNAKVRRRWPNKNKDPRGIISYE